jgi:Protein of unknown function (DUF3667)
LNYRPHKYSTLAANPKEKENMTTICKNCNNHFEGNFCNHCGQTADTHKLSLHFIWHDLQHGLFHFDKGIFYTLTQLLTKPGYTIREFINGKRVKHFKPLSLVVILATLYGLLYHYFINSLFDVKPINAAENVVSAYEKVIRWITDHFAYATLILILNTTIASWLVFKKRGYNFAEHLVLNTFYTGLVLVITLILFPVIYIYHNSGAEGLKNYAFITQVLDFVLMYWCYAQFFNTISKIESLALTTLTYLFMSIITLVIGYVAGWIIISVVS